MTDYRQPLCRQCGAVGRHVGERGESTKTTPRLFELRCPECGNEWQTPEVSTGTASRRGELRRRHGPVANRQVRPT